MASGAIVKITDSTKGAVIYYTTTGTAPTAASAKYPSTGIKVTKGETIKAIGMASGYAPSPIASASFTIK